MVSMKDEDFEKTMDNWAADEVESAPQLRPTEEIYRMIKAQREKSSFPVYARRVLVGVATACLVLSVIILPVILNLSDRDYKPSIGLRRGFEAERGVITKYPPRRGGKGPKKMAISFHQLMFHYQKADTPLVYGIDIRFPQEEKITLTTNDNYRLVIQPASECYIYTYQLDSCGELVKLFPNNVYTSVQNPLQQEQTYHVPSEPNWLYLGEKEGEERIYVVASAQPVQKLEELYAQYDKADNRRRRQESLSHFLKELDGELPSKDGIVWRFVFNHQ